MAVRAVYTEDTISPYALQIVEEQLVAINGWLKSLRIPAIDDGPKCAELHEAMLLYADAKLKLQKFEHDQAESKRRPLPAQLAQNERAIRDLTRSHTLIKAALRDHQIESATASMIYADFTHEVNELAQRQYPVEQIADNYRESPSWVMQDIFVGNESQIAAVITPELLDRAIEEINGIRSSFSIPALSKPIEDQMRQNLKEYGKNHLLNKCKKVDGEHMAVRVVRQFRNRDGRYRANLSTELNATQVGIHCKEQFIDSYTQWINTTFQEIFPDTTISK